MQVLVANLNKNAARIREQLTRDNEAIAHVREIGVNPKSPRIAKRSDLLRLTSDVASLVLDIPISRRYLPIRPKIDPIRRVHVKHLNFAPQSLFLRQRVHYQQRVAEDQPVGPVAFMLVEIDALVELFGQAVEVREELQLVLARFLFLRQRGAEVFDDVLRVDLLLDVNRHGGHGQILGVLLVLSLPNKLRIERRITGIEHRRRLLVLLADEVPQFFGRDVRPLVLVPHRVDLNRRFGFLLFALCGFLFCPCSIQVCPQMKRMIADQKKKVILRIRNACLGVLYELQVSRTLTLLSLDLRPSV